MFKPRFASLVQAGIKRQTIRPVPKRMPKVGDRESWRAWKGKPYRSKQRELAQVVLHSVFPVRITKRGKLKIPKRFSLLTSYKNDVIAKLDGFLDFKEMVEWFKNEHGLPFKGILIDAHDPDSYVFQSK